MFGINLLSLIIFFAILVASSQISLYEQRTKNIVLNGFAVIVLVLSIIRFINNPGQIPVEYSTVSYFTVPIIILLKIKKIEIWAVYASIMAGFFYYLTMILAGEAIYGGHDSIIVYISWFNHGTLLLIGLVKLQTVQYKKQVAYVIVVGNILMLLWALFARPLVTITNRLFIYEIIDATYLDDLGVGNSILLKIAFYILLTLLLLRSRKLIFKLNELGLKRRNYLIEKEKQKDLKRSG